ncbi:hypothetical protein PG994_012544 [Apiospora phragmitis]|uniref:Uncharacterized protein n=1 Tax=Apiospora phragmitis TaxID=2905665 RepID=A0ABR1TVZ4_9PEZI
METFYTLASLREELRKTLGFTSMDELNSWLESAGVQPFKERFARDYLASHHADEDASYSTVTNLLGTHTLMNFPSYDSTTAPNKAGWSTEKHWVRFIAQMGAYAKRHATTTPGRAPTMTRWRFSSGMHTRSFDSSRPSTRMSRNFSVPLEIWSARPIAQRWSN